MATQVYHKVERLQQAGVKATPDGVLMCIPVGNDTLFDFADSVETTLRIALDDDVMDHIAYELLVKTVLILTRATNTITKHLELRNEHEMEKSGMIL